MRSKQAQFTIEALKRVQLGAIPLFVQLAHKGLEKSAPKPKTTLGKAEIYVVPKDIMNLSVSDKALLEDIEAIEFHYERP